MEGFRHYITTRFNVGLYGAEKTIDMDRDEWMQHRIGLFTTFALPSLMAQSCQNFTWLVLIHRQTPQPYRRALEGIGYPNIKVTYGSASGNTWLEDIERGEYDLITSRIDTDDAFHQDMVKAIQDNWREQRSKRRKPWVMVFPFGFILDLATRELLVMEYWYNNSPTLVEDCREPQTIWQWHHSNIPPAVDKHYVTDKPYWLQVVHSQNLSNRVPVNDPVKIIHRQFKPRLEFLTYFGVDADRIPDP